MLTSITLILAAVALALLGVAMAYILGWANRSFYVEVDPRVEAIDEALPGANCGGCGYVGCTAFAEAISSGEETDLTLCGPGGASCAAAIAQVMGVDVGETFPSRAVVHCSATEDERLVKAEYHGEMTCAAANLISGFQGCVFGCMALGDCVVACDYDAIHVIDGRAVVDYDKCTGCKACATACPRDLISMIPFKADRMLVVGCSTKDFGNDVKAVCKIGCIGCKACARKNDLMNMDGQLPVVDYDLYTPDMDFEAITKKCKPHSLVYVGKASAMEAAATADEERAEQK